VTSSPSIRSLRQLEAFKLQQESNGSRTPEQVDLSTNARNSEQISSRISDLAGVSEQLMGSRVSPRATHATPVEHLQEPKTWRRNARNRNQPYPHVEEGLRTGEAQTFYNEENQRVAVLVTKVSERNGFHNYELRTGYDRLTVSVSERVDSVQALGRIADFYTKQPDSVRGAVDSVTVESGSNPENGYWAERYDHPGFRSAATGGGGLITFYEGLSNLRERTFDHEFGHNVGWATRQAQNREAGRGARSTLRATDRATGDDRSPNIPRGYSRAAAADGNAISNYGNASIGEDFAEFYEFYRQAAERGNNSLRRFARQHPNRYTLFHNEVLSRDLDTTR